MRRGPRQTERGLRLNEPPASCCLAGGALTCWWARVGSSGPAWRMHCAPQQLPRIQLSAPASALSAGSLQVAIVHYLVNKSSIGEAICARADEIKASPPGAQLERPAGPAQYSLPSCTT